MAHLSAVPIVLGDEERRALEPSHARPYHAAADPLRARMILHCDDGVGVREIARRLGVVAEDGAPMAQAMAVERAWGRGRGAPVAMAEERRAGQVRRRADLRHHRHRLRAAVGQRPADHPVVAQEVADGRCDAASMDRSRNARWGAFLKAQFVNCMH